MSSVQNKMYATIHEAAIAIRQKKTTPVELVEQCLTAIDRFEPQVRAWVFVDREGALAEARRLADELNSGLYRGPLHGIPIGIKDIFDVFDWPTAAGSKRWANSIARKDAVVVERLRAAGAVFLGKTVTTQYASFDPPVTRNPWNLEHTPGGSSSGSAAALASGMCLGALGSQTGGSITRPASYCGVAGMKPSYGVVSCEGVVPLAYSMDHPGPMARCVADLAILFHAIAGWPGLPTYEPLQTARYGRLGYLRGLFEDKAESAVQTIMASVKRKLFDACSIVKEIGLPMSFAEVVSRHRVVMAVEAAGFHERRLRNHPEDYERNIRALLEEGLACSAPEYARTKEHQEKLKEEMAACFSEVDALLTPATTSPAPDTRTTGDPAFNSPWSYTGLPTVSFPVGLSPEGLPLAIQLVGGRFQEAQLLKVAGWCEKTLAAGLLTPSLVGGG